MLSSWKCGSCVCGVRAVVDEEAEGGGEKERLRLTVRGSAFGEPAMTCYCCGWQAKEGRRWSTKPRSSHVDSEDSDGDRDEVEQQEPFGCKQSESNAFTKVPK